jgi:predicted Zn-dependent peptidase
MMQLMKIHKVLNGSDPRLAGLVFTAKDKVLKEEIHSTTVNGLKVYVLPKKGFLRKYAEMFVRYGSNDNVFVPEGKNEAVEVPAGIAHFLEHKMFEKEWGEAFGAFAKLGASANAFTSNNYTSYLYWTVENFHETLDLLFDVVLTPYFTEKSVEKEQGIISQEIRMYNDHPGSRLVRESLMGLYRKHPIRIDIAGTEESIRRIDKDLLYLCHRNFYCPTNMSLFVAGDVEPAEIFQLVSRLSEKYFPKCKGVKRRHRPEEPRDVGENSEVSLPVPTPLVQVTWKDVPSGNDGARMIHQEIATTILMDILFGRSSTFFTEVYEKGLVDEISYSYEAWSDYAFGGVMAQSTSPEEFAEKIWEEVARRKKTGIAEDDFARIKKAHIGRYITIFDEFDTVGETEVHLQDVGESIFSYRDILQKMTVQDVEERLPSLDRDFSHRTIVRNKDGGE